MRRRGRRALKDAIERHDEHLMARDAPGRHTWAVVVSVLRTVLEEPEGRK